MPRSLGRLRAQPAEPARGRPAGAALSRFRRPEPELRDPRGHPQALLARRAAAKLEAAEPGGVGAPAFLDGTQPSLEAQLCNLADEIAYNAHDIDDGVRSRAQPRRMLSETLRRMLSAQVYDMVTCSTQRLERLAPVDADAARALGTLHGPLIGAGEAMRRDGAALKRLLFGALYRHPQVTATNDCARSVVRELFAAYMHAPQELPPDHADCDDLPRTVADYIAGMTDRFAVHEHHRLTGRRAFEAGRF
jgi:dGTPase